MNRIALTAFSIVAGVALAGQAMVSQVPKIRWIYYRNDLLAFQIKVPAAWLVHPTDKAVGFKSPAKGALHAAIGILRSAEPQLTIEQAAQKEFEAEGNPGDWQQSYAQVGGMRAIKIIKNITTKPNTKMVEYYVTGPSGAYLLQCIGPQDHWALYSPLFATMLKTFQFLN